MVDVKALAKYLLKLNGEQYAALGTEEPDTDISPMKLQKLLYYCQGYALAILEEPLFKDPIEAWAYGPVINSVYQEYKGYKGGYIPVPSASSEVRIDETAEKMARLVMNDKGRYSPGTLCEMTHREAPWKEVFAPRENNPLSLDTMREYFSSLFAQEISEEQELKAFRSQGSEPTRQEWGDILHAL
ncbi:hypothetical protein FACS1894167_04780 [Synergistales bacterium]|nr:hypothetical protein FACS1894167_04780 [Synergistales bacterium]